MSKFPKKNASSGPPPDATAATTAAPPAAPVTAPASPAAQSGAAAAPPAASNATPPASPQPAAAPVPPDASSAPPSAPSPGTPAVAPGTPPAVPAAPAAAATAIPPAASPVTPPAAGTANSSPVTPPAAKPAANASAPGSASPVTPPAAKPAAPTAPNAPAALAAVSITLPNGTTVNGNGSAAASNAGAAAAPAAPPPPAAPQKPAMVEITQEEYSRLKASESELPVLRSRNEDLEARVRVVSTASSTAADQFPIVRRFHKHQPVWEIDLERAHTEALRLLQVRGSELKPRILLEPGKSLPVTDSRPNDQLSVEEFCERFRLITDAKALADIKAKLAMIRNPNRNLPPGSRTTAINQINETFFFKKQRMCIIVCGHESAGKTSLVEAIIGIKVGYSAAGRATRCPVVYSFEQLPTGSTDSPYFISGPSMAALTSGTRQPLSGLAKHVEDHMNRLKATPDGFSMQELHIRVVASDLVFCGTVIDCPGTVIRPEGLPLAEQDREKAFAANVREMIKQQVIASDIRNSVLLCVEYRNKRLNEGGSGGFRNDVLSKIDTFNDFSSRVFTLMNRNDTYWKSEEDHQKPWLLHSFRVDDKSELTNAHNEICNTFYDKATKSPTIPNLYYISMRNVDKLAGHAAQNNLPPAEVKRLRDELLQNTSKELAAAFERDFAEQNEMVDAKNSFDFLRMRAKVFELVESSVEQAAKATWEQLDALSDLINQNARAVRNQANNESKKNNRALVDEGWRSFMHMFEYMGNEGEPNKAGLPTFDMNFDNDAFCQDHHRSFPLQMKYSWPSSFLVESNVQTLETFMKRHRVTLSFSTPSELEKLFKETVDVNEMDSVCLVQAYERMVDRFMLRVMSVQLKHIHKDEFYRALGQAGQTHVSVVSAHQAASQLAANVLEILYCQIFEYFKTILAHFFHRAVDMALLLMRLPKEAAFVAKYRATLATLRHLLHAAVTDWVNDQVSQFAHSVSSFSTPGDHKHQAHHAKHAETVEKIKDVDTATGLSDQILKSLRTELSNTIAKQTIASVGTFHASAAAEFDLTGAQPLDTALRYFAFNHQKLARRMYDEFRHKKLYQIFGNPKGNVKEDHLKTIMEAFATNSVAELRYASFLQPRNSTDLHRDKVLRMIEPLSKKQEELYFMEIYGIDPKSARGNAHRLDILQKISEAIAPQNSSPTTTLRAGAVP